MNNRGKHILYNPIVRASVKPSKKSRQKLTNRRNDALACRFYFHSNINRLRYDDCLTILSNEFYLSVDSIVRCLMARVDYLTNLNNEGTTTAELRKMYPYYNWQGRLL